MRKPGQAEASLISIGGTFERQTSDGSRGAEVRGLACCPSGLHNLQMMNRKMFDGGNGGGFKIVDCWVMQCTWKFIHLCN